MIFDLKINDLCDPVILSYIFNTIQCMHVILSGNETVWPNQNFDLKVNMPTWSIFHGLVILLKILLDYLMD